MTEQEKLEAQWKFINEEITRFEKEYLSYKITPPKWTYYKRDELTKQIKKYQLQDQEA